MEFGKSVTIVEYDVTSGCDNDDTDEDQSYIYCSIARPLSPGNRFSQTVMHRKQQLTAETTMTVLPR